MYDPWRGEEERQPLDPREEEKQPAERARPEIQTAFNSNFLNQQAERSIDNFFGLFKDNRDQHFSSFDYQDSPSMIATKEFLQRADVTIQERCQEEDLILMRTKERFQ